MAVYNYTQIGAVGMQTCKSFMGFQSCSKKMTVSAPVRLSPSPPTWVVSRRTSTDGSTLNLRGGRRIEGYGEGRAKRRRGGQGEKEEVVYD